MRHFTRWLVGLAGLLIAVQVSASGILIGPLWLDSVSINENPNDVIYDATGGKWIKVEIHEDSRSRMTVFRAAVNYNGVPNAARVKQQARTDGIPIIVDGEVNELRLTGRIYQSATGARVWVEPGKLHAELGYVTSGLQPIAGGTMNLHGSRLWLTNLDVFKTEAASLNGTLEITAWNRTLKDANLAFAGGAQTVSTFTTEPGVNDGNVVLHVDMHDGTTHLWHAALQSAAAMISGAALEVGSASMTTPRLRSSKIKLAARDGKLTATLLGVEGTADSAALRDTVYAFAADDVAFGWPTGTATGTHDVAGATFGEISVQRATLTSPRAHIAADQQNVIEGPVRVSELSISRAAMKGTFDWDSAMVPLLAFMIPDGKASHVRFELQGQSPSPFMIAGSVDTPALAIGGVKFLEPVRFSFPSTSVSAAIVVPISIDVAPQQGRVEITDGANTVSLTADLRKLSLNATLTMTMSPAPDARLDVPAGRLAFDVGGAVATTPFLGATKPMFTGAAISASNVTALSVSAKDRSGILLINSDAMVVADPILRIGEANAFRARVTLNATGGVTFAYCLTRGALVLTRANLSATEAAFSAQDAGAAMDLGGAVLTDPNGSIENLAISVDRLNNQGSVSSGAIRLGASHISRPLDPNRPNDIGFDGDVSAPLTVASVSGTPRFLGDRVELTNLQASGISVRVTSSTLYISQAIRLSGASFALDADAINSALELTATDSDSPVPVTPESFQVQTIEDICTPPVDDQRPTIRREYFTNVRFHGDGRLHIDGDLGKGTSAEVANDPTLSNLNLTVSGRSDRLDGNGGGQFSGFAGLVHSAIVTSADCDHGDFLRIPMDTVLGTGGGAMTIRLEKGKSIGKAALAGFAMAMTSTASSECHGPWHKQVLVPESTGWTDGICPTWSEPFRHCRWSWTIPEVSYQYRSKAVVRSLQATVALTVPFAQFSDHEAKLCSVGPAAVGPVFFLGGYYPEFTGSVPVVSDVANALIGAVAEVTESTIAMTLANGAGALVSSLASQPTIGVASCVALGVWR